MSGIRHSFSRRNEPSNFVRKRRVLRDDRRVECRARFAGAKHEATACRMPGRSGLSSRDVSDPLTGAGVRKAAPRVGSLTSRLRPGGRSRGRHKPPPLDRGGCRRGGPPKQKAPGGKNARAPPPTWGPPPLFLSPMKIPPGGGG